MRRGPCFFHIFIYIVLAYHKQFMLSIDTWAGYVLYRALSLLPPACAFPREPMYTISGSWLIYKIELLCVLHNIPLFLSCQPLFKKFLSGGCSLSRTGQSPFHNETPAFQGDAWRPYSAYQLLPAPCQTSVPAWRT